ncbi:cysteine hydrolase family protein [Pseudomonas sp. LFM046]|uniref:cysteine hydrolase family protein n=1 Tax=Pseudomonas sp. LFM046 TaxID=1608357 RepID=UPI0005CFC7A3|nr:cysteine hydrolase family protein [Pseudomonas sp. LFM046]
MKTALLIIDVQQALSVGIEAAFEIERVIDTINGISTKARAAGLPVVLIQHEEDNGDFRFGSDGWQLAEGLAADAGDYRVRKTTPDSFHKTDLQAVLQEYDIQRLIVCGLQTDFCVDTTVRRALALGYEVTLVADGHSTLDNGVLSAAQIIAHHNKVLGSMSSFGVRARVVPAAQVSVEA